MATILNSDLTRETTVKVDEREIQLTLTANQTIEMKLKGMKTGTVEVGIEALYHQLKGSSPAKAEASVKGAPANAVDLSSYKGDPNLVMSISDIRSAIMISGMDLETTHKFESFLSNLIREKTQRIETKAKKDKEKNEA
jgi:hypothetical protein